MKKTKMLIIIFILLLCTSCGNPIRGAIEISDLTFVRAISIDKVPGQDKVKITIASKYAKTSTGGNSVDNLTHITSAEGATLFEAARNLNVISDKKPYFGHVEYLIWGEETVKDGIIKYLDFFTRGHQFRLNAKLIVVKAGTGEDLLLKSATKQTFISDRLDILFKDSSNLSLVSETQLHDAISCFDEYYSSVHIPAVYMTRESSESNTLNDEDNVALDTTAIIKNGNLLGYIQSDLSRGLNWMIGNIVTGIITVKDEMGSKISLEIANSSTKTNPVFNDKGDLIIEVKINVSSNIGDVQSEVDIFSEQNFQMLEKQQSEVIRSEVKSIINYAQENNVDVFGIWKKVYHKHPIKWKGISSDWMDQFDKIPFTVTVESSIRRTYIVKQPIIRMEATQ